MLQADNTDTTNQLLAYTLSTQRPHDSLPPAINATMTLLLNTSPFSPSASARWINSLFFVSLVVSLASALFGILAKQWIREYMTWNTCLGGPPLNVLLRQLRAEAWNSWGIGSLITAIPTLLEIAMILFVVGLVILLWTLDDVVALIVSIFAGAFLGAVAFFTVLPVILRQSPYKSPSAWALLVIYRMLSAGVLSWIQSLLQRMQRRSSILRLRNWRALLSQSQQKLSVNAGSWRDVDIFGWQSQVRRVTHSLTADSLGSALVPAEDILAFEQTSDPMTLEVDKIRSEQAISLFVFAAETRVHVRVLSWVQEQSQDQSVNACIDAYVRTKNFQRGLFTALEIANNVEGRVARSFRDEWKPPQLQWVLRIPVVRTRSTLESAGVLSSAFRLACKTARVRVDSTNLCAFFHTA